MFMEFGSYVWNQGNRIVITFNYYKKPTRILVQQLIIIVRYGEDRIKEGEKEETERGREK